VCRSACEALWGRPDRGVHPDRRPESPRPYGLPWAKGANRQTSVPVRFVCSTYVGMAWGSAGRDALTGPFRDPGRANCPGPAHQVSGGFLRGVRQAWGRPVVAGRIRPVVPRIARGVRYDLFRIRTCRSASRGYCLPGVRRREPRRAAPRPCPRSCSPRARARSPGSGGPWRACASHRRRDRAHAHDATGHARLPRP